MKGLCLRHPVISVAVLVIIPTKIDWSRLCVCAYNVSVHVQCINIGSIYLEVDPHYP